MIVNPCDRDDAAGAMQRALTTGYAERRRRWEKLMDNVVSENVAAWRESFVDALKGGIRTAPARLANDAA